MKMKPPDCLLALLSVMIIAVSGCTAPPTAMPARDSNSPQASAEPVQPTPTPAPTYTRIPSPTPTPRPDPLAPDLDVEYIQRSPAYPYDGEKKWPAPGEAVTFIGHIANRGKFASGEFRYRWTLDGSDQPAQTHPGLQPGELAELTLPWKWQDGVHTVGLALDPGDELEESSESNNSLEDRTNALALGIYVEQSFYDYFNEHIWQAGWGGDSFADWLQRNVALWNKMFAGAVHPSTPQGISDRVRLDKIVVTPDGGLHCNSNIPADDREVDLIWGFISELVGVASDPGCPGNSPAFRDDPSRMNYEPGLLHELTHARYLIDLYGLNIDAHPNRLAARVSSEDTVIPLEEIPDIIEYAPPFYLIIEGEIIICNGKSGRTASDCLRGQEHTYPRDHPKFALVFADKILVNDGKSNALAGGKALPADDPYFFYKEPYFSEDLMDSGNGYSEHSANAWNRIAGQRARCGNYNAPCNYAEYLSDLPGQNILQLSWPDGSQVSNAIVEVYQAKPFPIDYGTSFDSQPDIVLQTDAQGKVDLGGNPFGDPIVHTYGHTNAVILLKISGQGRIGVLFFPITYANIAYWSGEKDSAVYPFTVEHYKEAD